MTNDCVGSHVCEKKSNAPCLIQFRIFPAKPRGRVDPLQGQILTTEAHGKTEAALVVVNGTIISSRPENLAAH